MKNLNDPDQFGPIQQAKDGKKSHQPRDTGRRNIIRFDPATDSWHK